MPIRKPPTARLVADPLGDLHHPVRGQGGVFAVSARAEPDHAVADLEVRGCGFVHGCDLAGRLLAENEGEGAARRRIQARAEVGVDVVDARELVLDQHLARFEFGDGEVGLVFENAGVTVFGDDDGAHGGRERGGRHGADGWERGIENGFDSGADGNAACLSCLFS